MASAFAANMGKGNVDDDDKRDYPADALSVAAELEGDGAILQDYYLYEEYIHRRGTYIGKLPAYSHLPNACFIARRHAGEIFSSEYKKLDVEEVRRREIAKGIDPLLPMPTTSNTATIDNFKTCAPKGVIWKLDYSDPDEESSRVEHVPHSTPATSPVGDGMAELPKSQTPVQQNPKLGQPVSTQSSILNKDLPDLSTPNYQGYRVSIAPTLAPQPHTLPRLQPMPVLAHIATEKATATPVLSQPAMSNGENTTSPNENSGAATNGRTPGSTSDHNPSKTTDSTPEKVFTPHPDVSSMANFGIVSAVKATKRALEPEPQAPRDTTNINGASTTPMQKATAEPQATVEQTTSVLSTTPADSMEPAPKRQRGSNGEAHPISEPLATQNVSKLDSTSTLKPTETTTPSSPAEAKPTAADKKQQHLESVITGTVLPTTKAEAHAAAKEHHARLLAAAVSSKSKSRRTSARQAAASTPDIMPFLFSRDNYIAYDDGALGNVRCICGCVDPDGGEKANEMVNCETCGVWQHYGCVLPGMSEKQVEGLKKFECTVCDPWGRREVLMKLRAGKGKLGKK